MQAGLATTVCRGADGPASVSVCASNTGPMKQPAATKPIILSNIALPIAAGLRVQRWAGTITAWLGYARSDRGGGDDRRGVRV
jgi:hypothetical protein